jgi:cystathionine beta-lyase
LPVDPVRTVSKPPASNLVRLHIGLEDADDLIADLEAAFDQAGR